MYLEISNPMDYHVALYIRLSKEDENEGPSQSVQNQESLLREFVEQHRLSVYDTYVDDGFSGTSFDRPSFQRMIGDIETVQNQESLLREFVEQHRLSVYDTYVDDGFSGTSFDRPSFQRMIGDIETKKVNMVITKDLSRLGRDYIMTGHYMERYFPEHRVRYISLLDGIDTGVDSTANDITPFRAIMNDMYAKDISKKIKSVKRDKQRKGQFIGGKPMYGYKMHPTKKNKIVIDEEVAPVVRRIFALALSGMSCRKIATTLNEEGIPTPAIYCGWKVGNPGPYTGLWSSERISEMLKNETYIGNMVQGRTGVDSTANDITPFRAIMNDMYAKDISKKIKSVKRDKQRKGQFIGGKPMYGYKMHPTKKNKIVIDEEVAPVVRRIFALALSGMSCRKIATTLNEEGIPTPAIYCGWKVGNPGPYTGLWSSERISEMLKNETYIGNMVQGRSVKISYKSQKCLRQSPENWVVVEGTHEPIIDPETFQKVQLLVNSRKHTRSRTYDFLLTSRKKSRALSGISSGRVSSSAASPCTGTRCTPPRKTRSSLTRKWLRWCGGSSHLPSLV